MKIFKYPEALFEIKMNKSTKDKKYLIIETRPKIINWKIIIYILLDTMVQININ